MSDTTQLQVEITEEPGHDAGAILTLNGEVDMSTAARLDEAFQVLADNQLTDVIVDASQVSFMDSTGLHALISGKGRIHDLGTRIALVASPQVRRVLELIFPDPPLASGSCATTTMPPEAQPITVNNVRGSYT